MDDRTRSEQSGNTRSSFWERALTFWKNLSVVMKATAEIAGAIVVLAGIFGIARFFEDEDGGMGTSPVPSATTVIASTEEPTPIPVQTDAPTPSATTIATLTSTAAPTVVNSPETGNLRIWRLDQDGDLAGGGCYQVFMTNPLEGFVAAGCDNGPNDGDAREGVIFFGGLPEGMVDVIEQDEPPGQSHAFAQTTEIVAGTTTDVELSPPGSPF